MIIGAALALAFFAPCVFGMCQISSWVLNKTTESDQKFGIAIWMTYWTCALLPAIAASAIAALAIFLRFAK